MHLPHFVGLGVTSAVILTFDLPIDWLCALAVFCGAIATYATARVTQRR